VDRHAYKIPVPDPYGPGEISVAEAARQLGCSTGVIYHWIHTGQLTARRGSASRFCIPWNAQAEAACRTRIAQSAHLGRPTAPSTASGPSLSCPQPSNIPVRTPPHTPELRPLKTSSDPLDKHKSIDL
jgi:excisionase family DNA binding protein